MDRFISNVDRSEINEVHTGRTDGHWTQDIRTRNDMSGGSRSFWHSQAYGKEVSVDVSGHEGIASQDRAPRGAEDYKRSGIRTFREELIRELVLSKINEERAKKGYEVKGVGAEKKYIKYVSKNIK